MGHVVRGVCRLCGETAVLTKEHIPPAGAYKGRPYRVNVLTGDAVLEGGKGRMYQRGFYAQVLCERCNNITGGWYGDEFARWSQWGFSLLESIRDKSPSIIPAHEGYPLRIAKQIVCTMIASANDGFADHQPALREFVLNREAVLHDGSIRLATYLCPTSTGRSTGVASSINLNKPGVEPHTLVEFALPPFGYVLTLAGEPLDDRPVDISWFAACAPDDRRAIELAHLPALPTHEAFPGDYRTKDEIRRDAIVNVLTERGHPSARSEAERIMAAGEGPAFFLGCGEEW